MEPLHVTFFNLVEKYSSDAVLNRTLWDEINKHYSQPKRYYHNLNHLSYIIDKLQPIQSEIADWDCILFATFYHDIIYDIKSNRNEEDSADIVKDRLQKLEIPAEKISLCASHILTTKTHILSTNADTNIFTDADLSILSENRDIYTQYAGQIRKEYKYYPDLIYNQGRKKTLNKILSMDRIYKTTIFFDQLESKARDNIKWELSQL